ncbi:MAG TPA: M3 family oligoendopeptidase [Thermoleophilaceae bacterium]|nr:M3 family oligoendopeptidase [Thermoleophilaceae bacterium]
MTDAIAEPRDEALEAARWDLQPLVDGRGADGVLALMAEAQEAADVFAERYRGKVAELDAAGLAEALRTLEELSDKVGRAGSYAGLDFATDTQDPARGALMQEAQERGAALQTALLFFDLEWNELPDEQAERLIASDELAFCRHYLRTLRRYLPHQLSEPEERVLTETAVTGSAAFKRLFTEQVASLTVDLPNSDEPVQLMEALSVLQGPDRELRRSAAEGVTAALQPGLRTRAFIFNTLLADKSTKDRLRSYDHWLASRNLANEASDESVQALIDAVQQRYELARRWYRLKAKLLGVEKLAYYDRAAPVAESEQHVSYEESRALVLDCYREFSPEMAVAAEEFFTGSYIDAPPAPGKRGGAFCSYTVPSAHPYVLLNHTGRIGDALTMAHELGHGVHAALARPRGVFEFTTPLTVAETASIVGETIVLERLLTQAPDAAARLSLLAESLDGAVAAVFRQVAMNRFEHRVHNERRDSGELAVESINAAWLDTQADLLGDSVEPSEDYGTWWSYVPHFIDTPGYVYAYAYGHLLALSVYRRYEEQGDSFVPSYVELLKAGGSMPPEELGKIVGVDLTDPGFWSSGLDLIERQLEAAEAAAAEAGKL